MDFEHLTRAELIKITGFSGTAVDGWIRTGCPRRPDGTFRFKEVIRWIVARSKGNSSSPGLERLRLSQAKRSELKASVERGEVAPIVASAKLWESAVQASRSRFLALPHKLAPVVVGLNSTAEIFLHLQTAINECLDALAAPAVIDEIFQKTFPSPPPGRKPARGRPGKAAEITR